jgi:hypothetical protein
MANILIVAVASFALLAGCVTTPDGNQELSPVGEAALQASVSIATRHFILDSPRQTQRAQNIKKVIGAIRGGVTADSTLAGLRLAVNREIAKLGADEADMGDVGNFLDVVDAVIESKIGEGELKAEGVVKVSDFLDLILRAVPSE